MVRALFDRPWKRLLCFALIAGITYLPSAVRLTFYRDDWYYAYDALVGPAGVFRLLFSSDRPARGPFFELYFALFGMAPLPYQLAMFFWRLVGGLAVAWLFSLLWPRRAASFAAGLLFALYPGFTWWVAGIEYQPMVASAALMVVSLALTVQALRLNRPLLRTACILGAICTGWIYLALVEYAAGMEVLRIGLIFVMSNPAGARTLARRAALTMRRWLVYLIIPAGFLIWRFLLFTSQRKATDLGAQLGGFSANPLSTGLHWLANFLLSLINVAIAAWVVPLVSNFFSNPLREVMVGLSLALLAGALGWIAMHVIDEEADRTRARAEENWPVQAMWLGLAGLVLGILPIIVANRQVTFPNFSHYALPASLGLVFAVVGLAFTISSVPVRTAALASLIFLSTLTHQGLGASALHEERLIANFWQQVAWRAPSLAAGTTLAVFYPNLDYAEDTDVVWGPAAYMYYLEPQSQLPVEVPVSALPMDGTSFANIQLGRDSETSLYRAHTMTLNYDRVLVASQPGEDACVHVVDSRWPMLSASDPPVLGLLAPFVRIDGVDTTAAPVVPPASVFGPEPRHAWCYYFEKASLAAQKGAWQDVAGLQADLARLGLHPNDQVEWMPFLQAQAFLGNLKEVRDLATRINTQKSYRRQACQALGAMPGRGYPLSPAMQSFVSELFCAGRQ